MRFHDGRRVTHKHKINSRVRWRQRFKYNYRHRVSVFTTYAGDAFIMNAMT